jgi:hypothetical protein
LPDQSKHIVLLDFSLSGHHFSFCCSFSKILLQQGYRVSCLVPEVEKVQKWIGQQVPGKAENFNGFEYKDEPVLYKKWGRFNTALSILSRWKQDATFIRNIEETVDKKVDLVFYAWLDNNLAGYLPGWVLDRYFPWKWSGLYFHPYHLRQNEIFLKRKAVWRDHDSIFLAKNCIGVAIHDNGIVDDFSKRIGKPVIHFPETADGTAPDFSNNLYLDIREKAKGRLVVGMIGCEPHKGTLNLMRAVKMVNPEKFYFAFIGLFDVNGWQDEERDEVKQFAEQPKENCFFYFHPIPEGAAYNAVFSAFDIPYLLYNNFISSSNRLTKAAIFEKLVLAQNNYCVGDDVKEFNLGVCVSPNQPKQVISGLNQLEKKIFEKDFPFEQWKKYREINSEEKLYHRIRELISIGV